MTGLDIKILILKSPETFKTPQDSKILGWCLVGLVLEGEKVPLALVGHPFSDGPTIKIPYGVDVLLHQPASYLIFSFGLVKTEYGFTVRSVKTGLGR